MNTRTIVMQSQPVIWQSFKFADETFVSPPRHGWMNELAILADCDRNTVRRALYENSGGSKSKRVRQLYRAKYCNHLLC